jgi:hypothetical protein
LVDGTAYVGVRNLNPEVTDFIWYDLTDDGTGYPADACSIAISTLASASAQQGISIEVLTTEGEVFETVCDSDTVMGTTVLDCDEVWEPLVSPDPNDPDAVTQAQPERSAIDPNHRVKDMK